MPFSSRVGGCAVGFQFVHPSLIVARSGGGEVGEGSLFIEDVLGVVLEAGTLRFREREAGSS